MPINTCLQYTKNALEQLPLPLGLPLLDTFIAPYNPNDDTVPPGAYIWPSTGDEQRLSVPRAAENDLSTGGNKELTHHVDVFLIWFGADASDPNSNIEFPAILDAIMARLRNVSLIDADQHAVDPVNGQESALLAVGEGMSYQVPAVRSTADQRQLRYDALVTCEIVEVIQA